MNLAGSLVIAFSMYSRIPMPQVEWTKERMKYAMCFFPLIGIVIGALVYGSSLLLHSLGFLWAAKLFPIAVPVLITGGIHMDGFLDVVDARSSHGDKEKMLQIMKDPHTGAFAIIGCCVYFLLYVTAFGEIDIKYMAAAGGIFVMTRALSGLAVVTFPMAKNSGLAASFSGQADRRVVKYTMFFYLAAAEGFIMAAAGNMAGIVAAVVAGLTYMYYYRMAKKEFGGITGDLAGYFLQLCELWLIWGIAVVSRLG